MSAGRSSEIQHLKLELKTALEQQAATAEILRVISQSPKDAQPIFDMIAESAARLCKAEFCFVYRFDGQLLHFAAHHGLPRKAIDVMRRAFPAAPGRGSAGGRAVISGAMVFIPNVDADPDFELGALSELIKSRAALAVPMLRDGIAIGAISIAMQRAKEGDAPAQQTNLLRTFADQAVIAIENVRLFEEAKARNQSLTESLEQQTGTGAILKAIAASPTDIQPVLKAVVENAARLCGADDTTIFLRRGDTLVVASHDGAIPIDFAEWPVTRDFVAGRAVLDRAPVHVHDVTATEGEFPDSRMLALRLGVRTMLATPLLRAREAIGVLMIRRAEVHPFTDRQIELLKTFADQAVIAIENVRLFEEVQSRNRDLTESLERQTAMSDILRVISRSPTDVQPVFETIAESAARLCGGHFCTVFRFDGELIHFVAQHGLPSEGVEEQRRAFPKLPGRGSGASRAIRSAAVEQIPDVNADPDYEVGETARAIGARSVLAVPMLRDGRPVGSINIGRTEPGYFPPRQVELLQTFADQAVIAIENVRLFEEVQARTAELSEALQQQTATADVLKVISRSAFDLQPVFQALIDSAARLCGADMGAISLRQGDSLRFMAGSGQSPKLHAYERSHPHPIGRGTFQGRAAVEGRTIHVPDVLQDAEYERPEAAMLGDFRAVLSVPLRRGEEIIGVFGLARRTVGPFATRQIELVETFADQAVIAIENVRLFEEVQARTAELGEALQQQTATADVLKVISRSAFDLGTVLNTLIASACQLCNAEMGLIFLARDGSFSPEASHGTPPGYLEFVRTHPIKPGRETFTGRAALTKAVVNVADALEDKEFTFAEARDRASYRAMLAVPLLRQGEVIGVFAMPRRAPGAFSEKQVELVQTFADQAVIAIENVRLFNEVQARTRELEESLTFQKGTGDVLEAIGRSASKLGPVLEVIVDTAADLCRADMSLVRMVQDGLLQHATSSGRNDPAMARFSADRPSRPIDRSSASGRAILDANTVHIPDLEADTEYTFLDPAERPLAGTALAVPLIQEGRPVGVITLLRRLVDPFTDRQIELVQTFADQAVIAIENVRLFDEVQHRTEELSRSLEELRTAQDRLIQTEKLASLGQLTAGIAHEIKNPLNFVNNFSALSAELIGELQELLSRAALDEKMTAEVNELSAMLKGNLEKVTQHGKRADSIVKNMLLHSRQGSGEHRPSDINAIVEESLNLAYHGARAEKKSFNITLEKSFDPQAGEVDIYAQEITRVLINLISNGFYATAKRSAESSGVAAYEPMLAATTKSLGDSVEIRIRDNGTGIPPEVKEKMFNPFFTTKPAGEGTGLGLSLSHDIIVKQHAGTIDVESEPGSYTEFRILLPRGAALLGKSGGDA